MIPTDVILIGAGPIGIELAVALKHAKVDYVHLEAGQIGQTISWYPRQARFFSSPERIAISGVPLVTADQSKATREEYLAYLRGVVQQYQLDVQTYQRVSAVERDEQTGTFNVHTRKGGQVSELYTCKRVVLAIGDMHRPRLLHVPGEDLPNVSHYFDEPHPYFNQNLLIVGGRNSAVEASLRCYRAGEKVAISYRRKAFDKSHIKYWLLPEIESLIKNGEIAFYPETTPQRFYPDQAVLKHADGMNIEVQTDFSLLMTGYEMDHTLLNMVGIKTQGENQAPIINPETNETSVPNVYMAGTAVAGTQHKFKLFIENAHVHVSSIMEALTGQAPPAELVNPIGQTINLPES